MENNLPKSWIECTLGDVCTKPQYGWTSKASKEGKVKYLRTTDISNSKLTWETVPYCLDEPDDVNKYQVHHNDILVSRAGSVGFNFRIAEDVNFKAVFASYLIRFRTFDEITSKYISYFLKSESYWKQILDFTAGIAIPNVNASKLEELRLPLAPLAEQQRIVAKLDGLMEKIDRSRARLERIPKILKRFRQSVLNAAVTGKLTEEWRERIGKNESAESLLNEIQEFRASWIEDEIKKGKREPNRLKAKISKHRFHSLDIEIPTNWIQSSLLYASQLIVDCHNKTAPYENDGIYLVRTTNVKDGKILLDEIKYVSQKTYEFWSKRCPPESGDIIFTREAPMGEAAIIPDDTKVCLGQRTMLLRLPKQLINKYVLYCLMAPKMVQQINEKAIGSGVKHLRVGDVESLVISIPPYKEQAEIVLRAEKLLSLADKIEIGYNKAKTQLDDLPLSLLAKAFRGELVSQYESDEPATLLLEKIKAEKASVLSTKSKVKDYVIEPVTDFNIAADSNGSSQDLQPIAIPENKKAFAKQVLGGKIVSLFKDDPHFTHIKFQKLQYLAEHLAEVDLNWNYYRQSAGPYDPRFMHTVALKLKTSNWFEERKYRFYPLEKADKIEGYYHGYFKQAAAKLDFLFTALKNSTEDEAEIVATLYAVWNNMIIKKERIDDDVIVSTFFEWSDRKKKYTPAQVAKALAWMKKSGFVPTGFGKVIKEKKN
jgi:type I restriction enzyme, S subunit